MPSTPTRRSARRSKRPTPLLLTSLPDELLLAVIERLAALRLLRSLSSLQGASRHFYTLVTPALYHTIRLGRSGYPFTQTGILHVFDHLSLADCITAACGQDEIEAAMKDRHPLDVGRPYRIRWSLTLVKRLILGNVITKYAEEAAMDEGSFHLIATMLGLVGDSLLPSVSSMIEEHPSIDWHDHNDFEWLLMTYVRHEVATRSLRWIDVDGAAEFLDPSDNVCIHGLASSNHCCVQARSSVTISFGNPATAGPLSLDDRAGIISRAVAWPGDDTYRLTVIDPLVYLHPPHLTSTATTNGDEQRDLLRLKSMARQIYISKRAEANDWRAEAEKIFDERVEWLLPSDAAFTGTCPICHDDLDTICDGEDTY